MNLIRSRIDGVHCYDRAADDVEEDMTEISADWDTLLRQASMTADTYMGEAIDCIDEKFGDGFAEKNPDLVGAFMKVAALDFGFATLKLAAQDLRDGLYLVSEGLTRGKK